MDLLTVKIISMVLLGALSLFFGLIPLRIQKRLMRTDDGKTVEEQKKQRRRRELVVSCLLCFGAGVLLATVFIHMLPETRESVALIYKVHYSNDAKHEHLRDDREKDSPMLEEDNRAAEGSGDPMSVSSKMMNESDGIAVLLQPEIPATHPPHPEHHSHDDSNHVHRRSADSVGNEHSSPVAAESSGLKVVTTERNGHGAYGHGNHDHDNDPSGILDHEQHAHENESRFEGSDMVPEAATESAAASQTESATKEGVDRFSPTTDNNIDAPSHNDQAGPAHADGDHRTHDKAGHDYDHAGHDHDHAGPDIDHAGHDHGHAGPDIDHAGHDHDHAGLDIDHAGHDHDHAGSDIDHAGHNHASHDRIDKEGLADINLAKSSDPSRDPTGGRSIFDHSGHLHDHGHGPYDRTHANLQHDENLPRTSESPHAHHDHHDHDHDHASEVLPLHKGEGNYSSSSIQDFSEHDGHLHHEEHDSHDHSSSSHAHEHGHDHEAHAYPIAELLICFGFFFVYLVEEIIHKIVFHRHSHSTSKRGSKQDGGGIVLKNRHSEEDRLPPVTNGTYRSRSVHSNVHPYAAENGSATSGDSNARVGSGGDLPPKDVWSTSGVDNPSFVNETEMEGQLNQHAKESDLVDVALDSPLTKSNSSTLRSFPFEFETPKEPLFRNNSKKSMKNKKHENNDVTKVEELRLQRLYSITSDYGSQMLLEDQSQLTIAPCYDTMGNSLIPRRFRMRRHSSPIIPEHLKLQMSRMSVTPNTAGHGHSHMADISELKSQDWVTNLRSMIIVLALSFHAVFEGLAVGLQQNGTDVWSLFYAIAAHKFVIAFCVGMELIAGGTKVLLTVAYIGVFSLVTPLGISIGIIITEGTSSPNSLVHMWIVTILQGIAGGTILYVTFCEVLERERNRKNGRFLKFFALVIGYSTMAIIQLVAGHKHSH